jgi:hypothetical protein
MHDLLIVLDFLSRAFAVMLAIGGILGFIFRRWVGAWIDAHFKRQVDTELRSFEHQFLLTLEDRKTALAKDLVTETEQLKIQLAKDLEREKREIDEEFRRRARLLDQQSSLYEVFELEYGAIFSELYALDGDYIDDLNSIDPRLGNGVRDMYLSKAHRKLVEAQEKLAPYQVYVDSDYNLRMAQLFSSLSRFMADGATDKKRLDELALEQGIISVAFKNRLLGETT